MALMRAPEGQRPEPALVEIFELFERGPTLGNGGVHRIRVYSMYFVRAAA